MEPIGSVCYFGSFTLLTVKLKGIVFSVPWLVCIPSNFLHFSVSHLYRCGGGERERQERMVSTGSFILDLVWCIWKVRVVCVNMTMRCYMWNKVLFCVCCCPFFFFFPDGRFGLDLLDFLLAGVFFKILSTDKESVKCEI